MPINYGPIALMLNGQIFNYLEIKKNLTSKGLTFHTSSDSEVLAASIYYYGIENTISQIDGMNH